MKNIVIYNYKIANDLLKKGFVMNEIKPNRDSKGILVFIFNRNQELEYYLMKQYNIKTF